MQMPVLGRTRRGNPVTAFEPRKITRCLDVSASRAGRENESSRNPSISVSTGGLTRPTSFLRLKRSSLFLPPVREEKRRRKKRRGKEKKEEEAALCRATSCVRTAAKLSAHISHARARARVNDFTNSRGDPQRGRDLHLAIYIKLPGHIGIVLEPFTGLRTFR